MASVTPRFVSATPKPAPSASSPRAWCCASSSASSGHESPLTIQPPGGKTAVNFTTYFFTVNVAPTTQTVRIIGQQVEIEATPSSYRYRFDGNDSVETRSAGGPYPGGDVTHEYPYKGSASPSIDTVYSGRYRVNGGAWREIPSHRHRRGRGGHAADRRGPPDPGRPHRPLSTLIRLTP